MEFNIRVTLTQGGLTGGIESLLEVAKSGFASEFRRAPNSAWGLHMEMLDSIRLYESSLETTISEHDDCKRLLKLEGVGTLNAINF